MRTKTQITNISLLIQNQIIKISDLRLYPSCLQSVSAFIMINTVSLEDLIIFISKTFINIEIDYQFDFFKDYSLQEVQIKNIDLINQLLKTERFFAFRNDLYRILAPKTLQLKSITLTMKDQLVVSMTGFVNDPQEQNYKKAINDLNIRLAPMLSEQTTILIVNDVTTQKYKIAKTYQSPIICVSIDWLLDSQKKGKIQKTNNYQIKKLFFGATIKILGFEHDKARKLESKFNQNGGSAKSIKNLNQMDPVQEKISLILTTKDYFAQLKPYLQQINIPIVDVEWLQDSMRCKVCKFPFDYALNQPYIAYKEPIDHYSKMKKKLELQLAIEPIDQLQHKMFDNCYIYMFTNVNSDLALLLKKLIMVFGGFYLDQFSPIVTHILTEPVSEQQHSDLKFYGALINIIRVEWLIDSIYINKKMKEEDYLIRCYKTKLSSNLHLQQRQNSHNYNSMSFNSIGAFGMSLPALNNRKSISVLGKLNQQTKHHREIKLVKKYESTIFKEHAFYIESTQKKQIQLCDLTVKIIKNGGLIHTSRAEIKEGLCYYILKDSSDCKKMIDRLKADTRGRAKIQPVSFRWINDCLNKGQFIDILTTESYIYKPFDFKTPVLGFHKMIIQVLGLDELSKMRLKQLYNALGSVRNRANMIEITHCLCGPKYHQTAKYHQLRKQNPKIKYLNWKWLIECFNAGKILNTQNFVIQKENYPATQQSENSNIHNIVVPTP